MQEKEGDLIIKYNANNPSYLNVTLAFDRLIGSLATASVFKDFEKKHNNYKEILNIIIKWSAEYEEKKDLSLINHVELLDVYYKIQELNIDLITKSQSELSDKIEIWYWDLMLLRKSQIEKGN